jgi:FkbM family methyltransferase
LRCIERRLFPDQGLPFEVDGGIRQYVHPSNEFEYLLLKGGKYQPSLNQFMCQNLIAGDSVAIAGISFGQQVVLASRAVGPSGKVIGIDPSPTALLRARMNLSLNNLGNNVRLVSAGLGDHSTCLPIAAMTTASINHGSFIKQQGELPFYVIVETLPKILEHLQIKKLNMLLLDVIGFEMHVLKGLESRILPNVMTVAIHPWALDQSKTTMQDYAQSLECLGYRCSTLEGTPAESAQSLLGCQLVAVRNDCPSPRWLEKNVGRPLGVWNT